MSKRKKEDWDNMTLSERKTAFRQHFRVYLVMCVFFFGINAATSYGNWWFYWPILGWGLGVAMQGVSVYGPLADKEEDLTHNDWDNRALNPPDNSAESLELPELEKRYRDDELV